MEKNNNYQGPLYGKIKGRYVELAVGTEYVDKLNDKIEQLTIINEDLEAKADSYDKLENKIAKCYVNENDDSIDLSTIGEIAASHFGYL